MQWFLRAIGVSEGIAGRLNEASWLWARPAVFWIGLLVLVPLAWFVIRRHRANLPHIAPGMRWALSACRIAVLLVLIIVLASPQIRLSEQVTQRPVVAIVVDESASMSLPAGTFSPEQMQRVAELTGLVEPDAEGKLEPAVRKQISELTRRSLADALLKVQQPALSKAFGDDFEVRGYRFADDVRRYDPASPDEIDTAEGDDAAETNLGGVLARVLEDAAGREIAGIIVLTDGRGTIGPDPLAVVADAGAPVFAIAAGSIDPPADVAIVDVLAPRTVTRGDDTAIIASIESHALDEPTVDVKLVDDEGRTIDSSTLKLRHGQMQQVELHFQATEPGPRMLKVVVDALPAERITDNNTQDLLVQVGEDKLTVLYLEGSPRWDFRFLDHAFRRDHGLEVTIVMEAALRAKGVMPADLPKRAGLPEDAAGFAEYDVVMLGDISPAMLPRRYQEQLLRAVEEDGMGLVVQAGTQSMSHAFHEQPLAGALPVRLATQVVDERVMPMSGYDAPAFKPFTMRLASVGAAHPIFQLYDDAAQNRRVWTRMPEFYWASAVKEATPGATVLAEMQTVDGERPLIAQHYYGRGRVTYLATDSTYRWRRNIGDHLFYRFWGQAVRHTANVNQRTGEDSWMDVYPSRVQPGETVTVELFAVDKAGNAIDKTNMTVQVAGDDFAERLTLERAQQTGHYRGTWRPSKLGGYKLSFADAHEKVMTSAVQVAGSDAEMRRPTIDRDLLTRLADATGGRVVEIDEFDRINEWIEGESQTVNLVHEEDLWDNWLTLLMLVSVYCVDVGVRRMSGLM